MKEKEYYDEINSIIETLEINNCVRKIKEENEKVKAYWEIGRLIVEAQGGNKNAKYGINLIKEWSNIFNKLYGRNYDYASLARYRKFYTCFPKMATLRPQLTWSHYRLIIPLKNENERNYYINQVILNNLSTRELSSEIKNKAFDRLSYADKENIKVVSNNEVALTISDMIKDPILLKIKDKDKINEKILHKCIIEMLENRFLELGLGFALIGHEYKMKVENHTYRFDLLFFNYKLNAFIVIELKTNNMKIKDIDQIKFYAKLVDKYLKEPTHNKTIGLLIAKEHDNYVIKYATDKDIFTTTYKLI